MRTYIKDFIQRGLMAAGGGPVILAIVYSSLGASGVVSSFSPAEVSAGILSVTVMAFIAGGISVIYSVEKLPLLYATLIHAAVLYADYLAVYLTNAWIPRNAAGIGIFTLIYVVCYVVVWLCVTLSIQAHIRKLNRTLKEGRA